MIRRATETDTLLHLTVVQERAVDLILAGCSDSEAARALQIHRTTVCRWRKSHPGFAAEIERRRAEIFGAAADKLRALLPKAVDVLANELNGEQRLTAAKAVCQLTGIATLPVPSLAPPSAEDILAQMIQAKMEQLWKHRLAGMTFDQRYLELQNGAYDSEKTEFARVARELVYNELLSRLEDETGTDHVHERLGKVRAAVG